MQVLFVFWLVWGSSLRRVKTADVEEMWSLETRVNGVNVDEFREDEDSLSDLEFQR